MKFTNYARTREYSGEIIKPKNENEIVDVIKNNQNKKIRVIGSLHSWSDQFRGADIYITLKENMNKIINFNKNDQTITVQTGAILNEIQKYLNNSGYVLRGTPQSKDATIGGIISNGTHGQGGQIFSENIIELKMIDGSGNKIIVNNDVNKELLPALKCNLGLCGIIYEVKLKVDKLKNVKLSFDYVSVDNQVKNYLVKKLNDKTDRSLILHSPYINKLMIISFNDVDNEIKSNIFIRFMLWILSFYYNIFMIFYNIFISRFITLIFWTLNYILPSDLQYIFVLYEIPLLKFPLMSVHYILGIIFYILSIISPYLNIYFNDELIYPTIDYLAEPYPFDQDNIYHFTYNVPVIYYESEFAIDINKIYDFFTQSVNMVNSSEYLFPVPNLVRLVRKSDNVLISTTSNQDSACISFFWFPSIYNTSSEAFYNLSNKWYNLMYKLKGRPHWAKFFNEINYEYIKSIYPNYQIFKNVYSVLDPNKIFSNNQSKIFE